VALWVVEEDQEVYGDSKQEEWQCQVEADQPEEGPIVGDTYAIVEPMAVMVEDFHASVAFPAMFWCLVYVGLADLADVLKSWGV
jgi:hypothetical protein